MTVTSRQITGLASGIAVVIGVLIAFRMDFWPNFGWMTPNGHSEDLAAHVEVIEQDIAATNQQVLNAINALSSKADVYRDEWVCDENTEELEELIETQTSGSTSAETIVRLEVVRRKLTDTNCSRFEQ